MIRNFFQKSFRYWHTIRYLRLVQIIGRVKKKIRYVQYDLSAHQGKSLPMGKWVKPAERRKSMLGEKRFCFLNECHEITLGKNWNNSQCSKLWLYNLHYFDDLNAIGAETRNDWHIKLIHNWVKNNTPGNGNGWEAYPSSLRIVNWIKWSLNGNQLDNQTEHSLFVQVRYLSKNLETHLLGNHFFANAKALIFAGLFFCGEEANNFYRTGLDIVKKELPEQVLPDGGNFELSTMYHAIFLEDLLDIVNIHRAYRKPPPKNFGSIIHKMVNWLVAMCHPDGEISFFNDAAIGISPSVDELIRYLKRLGFGLSQLNLDLIDFPDSGYSRIAIGDAVAIVDRASLGPDYLPAHAHADTLSFELSLFGQRVIVNSGTSVYGISPQRQRQRGTSTHSTITIDGKNSSEVWGAFRVARRAKVTNRINVKRNNFIYLSACHDGYQRFARKLIHCRGWSFFGSSLEMQDKISGYGTHSISLVLPLHPKIKINRVVNNQAFSKIGKKKVEFKFYGKGSLSLEKSTFHPEFGLSVDNSQLIFRFTGLLPTEIKTKISW